MHGLYLLWWVQERHVSAAAVASILAAGDLALTALEVPTGWLADRFGHRASLIAGSLLQVAGTLFSWLGRGVPGLLAASLLVALGDAFRSGADQALLYRSCVALEREKDFQTTEARARAVQLAAMVGLTLAGGAIVETLGFGAGWLVETTVCGIGLAIACAMVEPAARGSRAMSSACATLRTGVTDPGRKARQAAGETSRLIALILPAALIGGASSAASLLAQTAGWALNLVGRNPARVSILVAVITLAEAAGAMVAAHVGRAGVRAQIVLAAVGAALVAGQLAVQSILPSAFLVTVIGLSLLLGVALPLRAAAIQRLAAEGVRARTASIASACDKAFTTAALIIAGGSRPLVRRSRSAVP